MKNISPVFIRKLLLIFLSCLGANMSLEASQIEIESETGNCRINQQDMPAIGFGTYPLTGEVCAASVDEAIRAGYRILDTATYYENFEAIAKSLKDQNRSSFYIISKVWHDMQHPEGLNKDLQRTLAQLETEYIDAYLLHWPNKNIPIDSTLWAMEKLRKQNKIRHIGLSNVSINHLKKALKYKIPIAWVQVEMHPHFCDFDLIKFCSDHSITIQAWRPLNLGRISDDAMLAEIGHKHKKTACQVALKWIVQHGCIPLPGSQNKAHIQENMNIFDFSLSEEEMLLIDKRAREGERFRLTEEHGLGFADELDSSYDECWPTAH